MSLTLYNTLTRRKERFEPIDPFPTAIIPGQPRTFVVGIASVAELLVPGSPLLVYRLGTTDFAWSQLSPLGSNRFEAALPAAAE